MKYHVVTVAPLSSSWFDMSNAQNGDGVTEALPLSQKLAGLSTPTATSSPLCPRHDQASDASTTSSQPSLSSVSITFNQHQRISFRKFQINHLALFFLKGGKLPYVAFNEGMPNYFLSSEAIQAARMNEKKEENNQFPAYICGEIIFIDTFQATEVQVPHICVSFSKCLFRILIHTGFRTAHASMSLQLRMPSEREKLQFG